MDPRGMPDNPGFVNVGYTPYVPNSHDPSTRGSTPVGFADLGGPAMRGSSLPPSHVGSTNSVGSFFAGNPTYGSRPSLSGQPETVASAGGVHPIQPAPSRGSVPDGSAPVVRPTARLPIQPMPDSSRPRQPTQPVDSARPDPRSTQPNGRGPQPPRGPGVNQPAAPPSYPYRGPSENPSDQPSARPTGGATQPPDQPPARPSGGATQPPDQPSAHPSRGATQPPGQPSTRPSGGATQPPDQPRARPTGGATQPPDQPRARPSGGATQPPDQPSTRPSGGATQPPATMGPSSQPTPRGPGTTHPSHPGRGYQPSPPVIDLRDYPRRAPGGETPSSHPEPVEDRPPLIVTRIPETTAVPSRSSIPSRATPLTNIPRDPPHAVVTDYYPSPFNREMDNMGFADSDAESARFATAPTSPWESPVYEPRRPAETTI